MNGFHRMVIDTDTAADDSFALLVGLLHPRAQLEAVTIVAGNVEYDQQVANALITIDQAGRSGEVPVHRGCRRPLLQPWHRAGAHGDGKGDTDWPEPRQRPEAEHAVPTLVRLVDENPGEIDIVAIGPLTNIAAAVALDPELPAKTRSLTVMGGCDNSVGNVTAAAEYNFYVDPDAAQLVLSAGFSVTVVTWTLTLRSALWTRERLAAVREIDTPLARYFTTLNRPTLEYDEAVGIAGSTHPDSLTAMVLVEPEIVRAASSCYMEIERVSPLTRGYSLVDRRDRHPHNATVIDDIDADAFFDSFCEILRDSPTVDVTATEGAGP